MYARCLTEWLRWLLGVMPAVYLQGARQTGKTTLAKQLLEAGVLRDYVSFDDPSRSTALSLSSRNPRESQSRTKQWYHPLAPQAHGSLLIPIARSEFINCPPPLGSPRFARGTAPRVHAVPPARRGNLKEGVFNCCFCELWLGDWYETRTE